MLMTGSLSVEQKHLSNIGLVSILPAAGVSLVTLDAEITFGDAWGVGGIDLSKLRMAYGFGVRWLSPMAHFVLNGAFQVIDNQMACNGL